MPWFLDVKGGLGLFSEVSYLQGGCCYSRNYECSFKVWFWFWQYSWKQCSNFVNISHHTDLLLRLTIYTPRIFEYFAYKERQCQQSLLCFGCWTPKLIYRPGNSEKCFWELKCFTEKFLGNREYKLGLSCVKLSSA